MAQDDSNYKGAGPRMGVTGAWDVGHSGVSVFGTAALFWSRTDRVNRVYQTSIRVFKGGGPARTLLANVDDASITSLAVSADGSLLAARVDRVDGSGSRTQLLVARERADRAERNDHDAGDPRRGHPRA